MSQHIESAKVLGHRFREETGQDLALAIANGVDPKVEYARLVQDLNEDLAYPASDFGDRLPALSQRGSVAELRFHCSTLDGQLRFEENSQDKNDHLRASA